MKIAIIITQVFDPQGGGVERVSESISKIFTNFNHEVFIISYNNKTKNYSNNKVQIFSVNNEEQLKKILTKQKINILINQEGYDIKFTKLLLRNKSTETFIINNLHINPLNFVDNYKHFVGLFLKKHKLSFLNNFIVQKIILWYHIIKQRYELNSIIKNTNAFVMLSERFKPELYTLAPGLKQYNHKIHGLGNPFERPDLHVADLEKENIILFVGRLNIVQKRVDLLLEVWKELHANYPDWQFWVVGEGEDLVFMKTFCRENKLDRVTFFGKDNPNGYYKKAKLFHMTSAFEGFGNVLVEAQSYGCVPVLYNSYSAAQDIINHDADGILVKPFDTNAYVTQTQALIDNPKKLKKMAMNAFENVNRFSYEETYKNWNAVFKSLK